jgi:hypothetical protein
MDGRQEKGDTCEAHRRVKGEIFCSSGGVREGGNSCNGSSQGSTLINRKKIKEEEKVNPSGKRTMRPSSVKKATGRRRKNKNISKGGRR